MSNTPNLIGFALECAPDDADHAEDVLEYFCDAVDNLAIDGPPPDKRILLHLAGCFRRILDGVDPKGALYLNKRPVREERRRTKEKRGERKFKMACAVARRMRHGWGREEAILEVTEQFGGSDSTVRKAYELYGATIKLKGWDK